MKPFTESHDRPPLLSAKVCMMTILKNGIRMFLLVYIVEQLLNKIFHEIMMNCIVNSNFLCFYSFIRSLYIRLFN